MTSWLSRIRSKLVEASMHHDRIPDDIREQLPLSAIEKVVFFKLDEWTTDLICCEVEAANKVWFYHEEAEGWQEFVSYLKQLPGFRADWYQSVAQPPMAPCETVAYSKA